MNTSRFRTGLLNKGTIVSEGGHKNTQLARALAVELLNLGYIITAESLSVMSKSEMVETLEAARDASGANLNFTPFYPNFPAGVKAMSDRDLLVDQLVHYISVAFDDVWGTGSWVPEVEDYERDDLPLVDSLRSAKRLHVVTGRDGAREMLREIALTPVAISEGDVRAMEELFLIAEPGLTDVRRVVEEGRNRENITHFLNLFRDDSRQTDVVLKVLTHTKDLDLVLRAMLVFYSEPSRYRDAYTRAVWNLSDRDAKAVLTRSVPNSVRRAFIAAIGRLSKGYHADGFLTRNALWRAVSFKIHAYEKELAPNQRRALDIIHGNVEHRTVNSVIEDAMASGDVSTAVDTMARFATGQLYRRVVALARIASSMKDADMIANAIDSTRAPAMTTLISSYNGVLASNEDSTRVVRVPGRANQIVEQKGVDSRFTTRILSAIERKIRGALSSLDVTSSVGVDSDAPVPLVRRDLSTSDRQLDRGQEFDAVGSGDTIRLFIQWFNGYRRVDLDLGGVVLDKNFAHVDTVTWNSYHSARGWATYSGDVTDASGRDGAAEFIDVDIERLKKVHKDAEWVVMSVLSYTGQRFSDVNHFAGAMWRSEPSSGEIFEPRSVASAFVSSQDSTNIMPIAVNVSDGRVIWLDTSTGSSYGGYSIAGDSSTYAAVRDEIGRPRLTNRRVLEWVADENDAKIDRSSFDRGLIDRVLGL